MTGFHAKTVSMPRLRWKQWTKDKYENTTHNNRSRGAGVTKVESWEHPEVKAVKSQIAGILRKHGGKTGEELKAEGN